MKLATEQASTSSRYATQLVQSRGMAIEVEVVDNNINAAFSKLNRKLAESGLPQELRKRQHHKNKSEQRFERELQAYNRAVGNIIRDRMSWMIKRKQVK